MSDVIRTAITSLRSRYPTSGALEIGTPYHLLTLVAISARTRDEQVLKLAPAFFRAFPSVRHLAMADVAAIARRLGTIGLYQQKAKNLKAMAQRLVAEFNGEVPRTMAELTSLPGVGRKTASVVLAAAFGVPAIAVDTHVFRVVQRLGWAKASTPAALEQRLLALVPKELQTDVNHVFVPFGRSICITPQPRCWACPLVDVCAYPSKQLEMPEDAVQVRERIAASEVRLAALRQAAADAVQ